jgi:hypothetical protein
MRKNGFLSQDEDFYAQQVCRGIDGAHLAPLP